MRIYRQYVGICVWVYACVWCVYASGVGEGVCVVCMYVMRERVHVCSVYVCGFVCILCMRVYANVCVHMCTMYVANTRYMCVYMCVYVDR